MLDQPIPDIPRFGEKELHLPPHFFRKGQSGGCKDENRIVSGCDAFAKEEGWKQCGGGCEQDTSYFPSQLDRFLLWDGITVIVTVAVAVGMAVAHVHAEAAAAASVSIGFGSASDLAAVGSSCAGKGLLQSQTVHMILMKQRCSSSAGMELKAISQDCAAKEQRQCRR